MVGVVGNIAERGFQKRKHDYNKTDTILFLTVIGQNLRKKRVLLHHFHIHAYCVFEEEQYLGQCNIDPYLSVCDIVHVGMFLHRLDPFRCTAGGLGASHFADICVDFHIYPDLIFCVGSR